MTRVCCARWQLLHQLLSEHPYQPNQAQSMHESCLTVLEVDLAWQLECLHVMALLRTA